ncbi:uncharacterized protein G2W53_024908 [Senna tora]|uniref:Uncharacterized protein n=1 Tax=Senna tora TaxID=362788 RepID=A0A834WFX9_9FABA|nr:uncharacterized protein G2W53_024908 [Senna tora]
MVHMGCPNAKVLLLNEVERPLEEFENKHTWLDSISKPSSKFGHSIAGSACFTPLRERGLHEPMSEPRGGRFFRREWSVWLMSKRGKE